MGAAGSQEGAKRGVHEREDGGEREREKEATANNNVHGTVGFAELLEVGNSLGRESGKGVGDEHKHSLLSALGLTRAPRPPPTNNNNTLH
jgi:hypothetical protein